MATKDGVLRLLQDAEGYLSGQEMSVRLGVSRMAVNKAIEALRQGGYDIEAITRRGYRLRAEPEVFNQTSILAALGEHPWASNLVALDTVDSTNTYAKRLAAAGAPAGTVVTADCQTGGRGRLGRSFASPAGCGVYLSVVLRPKAEPQQLLHLTAMVAEAACQAVEDATGLRPKIKWTNDLVIGRKKLCGILTELSVVAESGQVDSVVAGIGINCNQKNGDFPPEIGQIATSLRQALGASIDRSRLAAALIRQLSRLEAECLSCKAHWLEQYARDCMTIGQDVRVVRGDEVRLAHADGIDENGALLVTYANGEQATVFSGEVSVRGMYGYAD